MRTCIFDIETSDLAAVGPGFVLCAIVKEEEKDKLFTFRYDQIKGCSPGNDKELVKELLDCLLSYRILIGHNIEEFDWKYLRTRAAFWGLDYKSTGVVTYDTLKAFRRTGFKTVSNFVGKPTGRLDHIIDFFGLNQEKTPIYPREHWVTVWGQGQEREMAMNKLVAHCKSDVRMTEEIYNRLWVNDPYQHFQPLK